MTEPEDDSDPLQVNETDTTRSRSTFRSTPTTTSFTRFPPYFIPRRPRVIKMRDLSPTTKDRLAKEYYDAYDPWTGIRIAATLGILISLFTLFLIYKSRFTKSKNTLIPSKKTSLYLYEDDLDCDLDNVGSSDESSSYAYPFRYSRDDRVQHGYRFGLRNEDFPLEEVFVKSSVVECVALTVHASNKDKNSKGPKYGTLRITEDTPRSLPCSPYKQTKVKSSTVPPDTIDEIPTIAKTPCSPTSSNQPSSFSGSITSFCSTDSSNSIDKSKPFAKSKNGKGESVTSVAGKKYKKSGVISESARDDANGLPTPAETVVSSKRPQDYRSRSTVVAIGRRKRKT